MVDMPKDLVKDYPRPSGGFSEGKKETNNEARTFVDDVGKIRLFDLRRISKAPRYFRSVGDGKSA